MHHPHVGISKQSFHGHQLSIYIFSFGPKMTFVNLRHCVKTAVAKITILIMRMEDFLNHEQMHL